MDNKRKAEGSTPDQPTIDAQKEASQEMHYSGGNALLDADIEAQATPISIEQPIVTNHPDQNASGNAGAQKKADTTGIYPSDFTELEDEGELSISHDQPVE